MISWIRSTLAVVAGFVSAFVVAAAGRHAIHAVFPPSVGADATGHESVRGAVEHGGEVGGVLVSMLAVCVIAALVGGWATAFTAPRAKAAHAITLGTLLLAAIIALLLHVPHPLWIWGAVIVLIIPAAYLGGRLGSTRGARKAVQASDELT
jgi:hypothetical protein